MNFAQQILENEEKQKVIKQENKDILLNSIQENKNHFFCFVTHGASQRISHRDKPGVENYTSLLTHHIFTVPEDFKQMVYSLEISTEIEKKNLEDGTYKLSVHSWSYVTSNISSLEGAFFIQNYDDLSEEQKKKLLDNIRNAYFKAFEDESEYSSQSPRGINFSNIIEYVKKDVSLSGLKDFTKELAKSVKPLVKNHWSKMLVRKELKPKSSVYNREYTDHFHTFTKEEQKQIIDSISGALLASPQNAWTLKPIKINESNFWEKLSNQAVEYFVNHENKIKENKKLKASNL